MLLILVALIYDMCIAFVLCAVKRSADAALAPDTFRDRDSENMSNQQLAAGGGRVPHSAVAALAASGAYSPPFRVPQPGQPLPLGVAAFGMAIPAIYLPAIYLPTSHSDMSALGATERACGTARGCAAALVFVDNPWLG